MTSPTIGKTSASAGAGHEIGVDARSPTHRRPWPDGHRRAAARTAQGPTRSPRRHAVRARRSARRGRAVPRCTRRPRSPPAIVRRPPPRLGHQHHARGSVSTGGVRAASAAPPIARTTSGASVARVRGRGSSARSLARVELRRRREPPDKAGRRSTSRISSPNRSRRPAAITVAQHRARRRADDAVGAPHVDPRSRQLTQVRGEPGDEHDARRRRAPTHGRRPLRSARSNEMGRADAVVAHVSCHSAGNQLPCRPFGTRWGMAPGRTGGRRERRRRPTCRARSGRRRASVPNGEVVAVELVGRRRREARTRPRRSPRRCRTCPSAPVARSTRHSTSCSPAVTAGRPMRPATVTYRWRRPSRRSSIRGNSLPRSSRRGTSSCPRRDRAPPA